MMGNTNRTSRKHIAPHTIMYGTVVRPAMFSSLCE